MDCAKVIAAAAKAPKDLWEMVTVDHQFQMEGVPWGAVVTLSGTGSEMDNGAGITNEALQRKGNLPGTYAEFAILDPSFLLTVPKMQLMACAFAQANPGSPNCRCGKSPSDVRRRTAWPRRNILP